MSNYVEKHLAEMIERYAQEAPKLAHGETLELEIRLKDVTREIFESLYGALLHAVGARPTLECSVNIVSDSVFGASSGDGVNYIRKMLFAGPKVLSDTYQKKQRIMRSVHIDDYLKYSVGLARESPMAKFSTNTNAMVRFKVRVSFEIDIPSSSAAKDGDKTAIRPAWRFDLTAVKNGSLADLGASLKSIKYELFNEKMTATNLLETLNFSAVNAFEVEVEYIAAVVPTLKDLKIIDKVFELINPQYLSAAAYQETIYRVATYLITNRELLAEFKQPTHRLKRLSNQVIVLTRNNYYMEIFPPEGYYLTIKADGQRAIVVAEGPRCRILLADKMLEFSASSATPNDGVVDSAITIVDAEMVGNDVYVFDVMVYRGENLSRQGFVNRVLRIDEAVATLGAYGFKAVAKRYVKLGPLSEFEAGFREIWEADYPFPRDGLILTEPNEGYGATKNYKWKPAENNTIDFLAIKAPQKMLGIAPYEVRAGKTLYLLFCGISHKMRESLGLGLLPHHKTMFPQTKGQYYPVQFSPSANPLAYLYWSTEDVGGKIVELSRDTAGQWVFHGVREDRKMEEGYYGNDYRIAELIYLNYIDPFPLESLWTPSDSYFTKMAADIYTAGNRFKRFVISLLLKDNLSGVRWVIDEAAGRGADLHRYQEIGVENALFMDIDPTAIVELIRRKYSFFQAKKRHVADWLGARESRQIEYDKLIVKDVKSLTVHTLVADLKTPYRALMADTYQFGINPGLIDGIVCNFAFHYMCDTIENMRNLLIFNARMLKVGGVFIFTVMDGEAVFALLKGIERGKRWESKENGVIKYAIRKDYTGDKPSAVGQMISVMLPFSDKMYEEPLCNVKCVVSEATKLGFSVELNAPMTTHLERFRVADKSLHDKLTAGDREYIGLHRYVSLRLVKSVRGE